MYLNSYALEYNCDFRLECSSLQFCTSLYVDKLEGLANEGRKRCEMAKKNAIITHSTIVDERRKSVLADMFKGSAQNSCRSSRFVSLSVSLFACKTSSVYENSVGFIFCYGNHSIACSGKLNLRKR